ncbi:MULTISPECIES: IS481 family transposase [Mycobacteriales]|uniref:IS481 family transposase n=5 Tax=Mycobacteriales TaxID=85007 RepID=A0A846WU53_9ACTN|nr:MULTISPECIES: IS481 family transposase [Mycobacteriales]NKY04203.1 IS481 family transposase [Gordonia polyisoprenivorans]NKY20750.1 IS481 family transposase [Tsukamurella spumae]NMD58405.1 IS481 family transposase [Tsukamurella columbiensis]QUD82698.1 IS481 family transposase [Gordonia polyisoprenivorans]TWS24525.1 IS481 family transposase [Tsukamurella conjunctivitidis]
MSHGNAFLTDRGRLALARCVVDDGWPLHRAAERFNCSPVTAKRWADRYRVQGAAGMADRSSRPHRCPGQTSRRRERRIIALRFQRRWGPARIAYHLRLPRSTVAAVLRRYRMPLLRHLDQATGLLVRAPRPIRYEHSAPGDLVHLDIKKLGRIPDGGGHRKLGRIVGNRHNKKQGRGYSYLHHAVDDHTRLAYSEILTDERQETATAFWRRAELFFAEHGIIVRRVLTDNGSCYRSKAFNTALGTATHKWTRPYRPQTNGKVERFNRTLAAEWAYAQLYRSDEARADTYPAWLHHYNHHRPHSGIGGQTPIERLRVHNVPGLNN